MIFFYKITDAAAAILNPEMIIVLYSVYGYKTDKIVNLRIFS